MGTKRVKVYYDVHCMDCGDSYEEKFIPKRCKNRRCKSENIFTEENSRYSMHRLFSTEQEDGTYDTGGQGYMEHTLMIEGIVQ